MLVCSINYIIKLMDMVSNFTEFIQWINNNNFEVIVWDMDRTMSSKHCGDGLPKQLLQEYIDAASIDFVTILKEIVKTKLNIKFAVATGSDPLEYNLHADGTHILGPDLAKELINFHCPVAIELFGIMVGYDCRLHENKNLPHFQGKRHHMRLIQQHFNVDFDKILLIDDSLSLLVNEDGWKGIQVNGDLGFQFSHCSNKYNF